ncbi:MAG TPA: SusC/RagA family TonB-linked outer membrane protein [Chitinophaga sp.]|uniref:SusC/RagA family TonB-linked outer membrane protein n=1 Tax=Chitinophaga sp. TaxID=1869181 RepID=UPI002DC012FF|nr:SusC/RagA family TonB-linked outer membrane protein [Chitinophaga sp.]HEU4553892.1 SusC/RagA family TonB-linked outer membrane protein [Chitinophaga sp.]
MKKIFACIMLCCCLLPVLLKAQNPVVRGSVTASDGGQPLPGVTIQVKGGAAGATTNADGRFSITVPTTNATLVFSFVGYLKKEVPLNGQTSLQVTLTPDTRELQQVVVTALGIKKEKRALGYAVQDVSGADLITSKQTNVVNALQGKVAGVQISSTGGAPGQGARIIIRGINSLDPTKSNQPLFVVDGIPIDNDTYTSTGIDDTRGMSNRAADINPDDVESISILRGGAATALYGLRAANGAVVITTKSGRAGRLMVSLTSTYGIDNVNKTPDVQTRFSQGYKGEYDKTSFWPSWGPTVEEARQLDPTHPASLFNNYKRAYKTGKQVRNTLNMSGGTEKAVFAASFSQFDQDGVIPFSDYKNYSAKLNGELRFSDKFKMGASMNYINSGGYRVNADRYGEQLIYWSPRWDVADYIKPDGTQNTYNATGTDNPMFTLYHNRFKDNVNRVIGNVNATYSPFKWLDLIYRVGTDFYNDARTFTAAGPKGLADEVPNGDAGQGFVYEYQINKRTLNSTFIANFKNNITPRLTSDLKLGHDLYEYKLKRLATEGDTLDIPDLLIMQNAKRVVSRQYKEDYRIIGVFADWTLNWDNYLYLTFSGREDFTSTLPTHRHHFFYPSVSAGYIFTDHLKLPQHILSYGKLRASWAKIGKDASPYKLTSGYETLPGGPIDNNIIGWTRADTKTDPDLKPEFTSTFEAGTELKFLDNRIGIDFTWYTSKSKDLVMSIPIPSSAGYETFYTNAGSIQNRGIEISLNGTPVKSKNFNWDVRVNFSANRNKVLALREGVNEIVVGSQFGYASSNATMKYIVGYPVGAIFGRSYARYYGNDTEDELTIDKSRPILIQSSGSLAGFPVINTTQKYLGNSQPKWIGSIYNTLSYKAFSLSFLFDVRHGVQKYNQFANFLAAFGASKMTENRDQTKVFDGVFADGKPNDIPVYLGQGVGPDGRDYGDGYYRSVYRGVTEVFIEDASWVRLRNVSLSYQLPSRLLSKTHFISGANITLTGNNLWLHTKYTGFDPESSSFDAGSNADAFAGFTYPAVRSFLASINVTF